MSGLIIEVAKKMREDGIDEEVVVRTLADETKRTKKQVKAALKNEEKMAAALRRAGAGKKGFADRADAQMPKYLRGRPHQRGPLERLSGAGRKSRLSFLYPGVKSWFETMRSFGHWVDKPDLVLEWSRLATEWLRRMSVKEAESGLAADEVLRKAAVTKKVENLECSNSHREKMADRLQAFCKARFLKPQRVVRLTLDEEAARCEQTWRCYDAVLHDVAFEKSARLKLFADEAQAAEHLHEVSLLYSDQVPFWIKIGVSKQLYAESEVKKKSKVKKPDEHFSQKRAAGQAEQSRFRVTLELTQVVRGYFSEGDPVGEIGKSSLVVSGCHARLSNISDAETWIEDEAFTFQGREVLRKAGQSTRGVMRSWVKLRRESAEVRKWLEVVEVYQQPAAFVDSIVMSWIVSKLAAEHPLSIHQRDMFAAAMSSDVQKASFLSHSAMSFISGKMTPVLQLTDTDLSFAVKAAAERQKTELRRKLRDAAVARNEPPPPFVCGLYEMLSIAAAAHEWQVSLNLKDEIVLKGLRRNGMLAYRPSLTEGKLVRSDTQKWAEDKPEGNHRMPEKWLKKRC